MAAEQKIRIEKDALGEVAVPTERLYGAQTERSLKYFNIGDDTMPKGVIYALALIKKAAAEVNQSLGLLPIELAEPIMKAADEVMQGKWEEEFPLRVWQTGSGTQSNMNVNEVIGNRALEMLGKMKGSKSPIHPNDHVNLSQSSNDVFPTAMHIAAALEVTQELLPSLRLFKSELKAKEKEFADLIKIGRTHLMDAVPMTLGQEFSGYVSQIEDAIERIELSLKGFYPLAIGGTAVGTGLNAPKKFGEKVAEKISEACKLPFYSAPNKFSSLSSHEPFVFASGALRSLACALLKISNDIRWMGSGPRAGLGELTLPENEPGSSIMPGKVNPTQCEALSMASIQVFGYDTALSFAASQGNFELNVYKPLIIYNFLESCKLLSHACKSFTLHLLKNLKANPEQLKLHVDRSLMLVTALAPVIGYDACAKLAQKAFRENKSLKEACLEMKLLPENEFERLVRPEKMLS